MSNSFYETDSSLETEWYGKIFNNIINRDGFSSNIIENYNNEIYNRIPETIKNTRFETRNGFITFDKVEPKPPREQEGGVPIALTPKLSRQKTIPYFSDIEADVIFTPKPIGKLPNGEEQFMANAKPEVRYKYILGSIPVMLGSQICHLHGLSDEEKMEKGECFNDPLGYFIVKSERVILTQVKLRSSSFLLYKLKENVIGTITFPTEQGTSTVVLLIEKKIKSLRVVLQHLRKTGVTGSFDKSYPIFLIYKILGMEIDEAIDQIKKFIPSEYHSQVDYYIKSSIVDLESLNLNTIDDCIEYVKSYRSEIEKKKEISREQIIPDIRDQLFYDIKTTEDRLEHLSMYAARMLEYIIGIRELDDRDSWGNICLETAGKSISKLFKKIWANIRKTIEGKVILNDGIKAFLNEYQAGKVRENFISAFGPNAWGLKGSIKQKENITEALKRDTPVAVFSQITKINSAASRQAKKDEPRMVHPSQLGHVCLTGDSEILLDDNMTTKKICLMENGDSVISANPMTLEEEPTKIKNFFMIEPSKVINIKTLSYRNVKCTPDHPFLVARLGKFEWVNAGDLIPGDMLIVKNYPKPLEGASGKLLTIDETQILDKHKDELTSLGLLGKEINEDKMKILARICGALWSDGTLTDRAPYGYPGWNCLFCLGTLQDVQDLITDIINLGFEAPNYKFTTSIFKNREEVDKEITNKYYSISKGGSFGNIFKALGVPVGAKGKQHSNPVPSWILESSLSVKREFLSGLYGGDGGRISVTKNQNHQKIHQGPFVNTCNPEFVESHMIYFNQLKNMIEEFGIESSEIYTAPNKFGNITLHLYLKNSYENLYKFSDIINYRYCSEKRETSALPIEFIRYRYNKLMEKKKLYAKILSLHEEGMKQCDIYKTLNVPQKLVSRVICRGKDYDISAVDYNNMSYKEFCNQAKVQGEKVFIPIESITEVETEPVYDFTTVSDNHSFFANGFLVKNCLFETPEGEGCGLIKNLAVSCYISLDRNPALYQALIKPTGPLGKFVTKNKESEGQVPLLINGIINGWCDEKVIVPKLKAMRKENSQIQKDVCIFYNQNNRCVEIYCDGGRTTRPLFVVDTDGQLVILKKRLINADIPTLIREGCIEYIDAREQEYIMLAERPERILERNMEVEEVNSLLPQIEKLENYLPIVGEILTKLSAKNSDESLKKIIETYNEIGNKEDNNEREEILDFVSTKVYTFIKENNIKDSNLYPEELYEKISKDSKEFRLFLLSQKPQYTHCEIDPTAIFSISSDLVPMANRQAGPRTGYQAGMNKQALGQYHSNEAERFDASYKMIYYPTKALFQNDLQNEVGLNAMPNGQTLSVAIMALPDNPEDGIIFKEEAVKYGCKFDMCKKMTTISIAKTTPETTESFERPPIQPGRERLFHAIDEHGLPKLDAFIRQGDCIIGKVRRYLKDPLRAGEIENVCEYAGIGEEGYVDRILITNNSHGERVVKVKIRKNRKYIPGDKMASRYSQKGTVSRIIPSRMLPRIASGPNKGVVPDIFINPHGQPSRMTLNKIIEIRATKAAAIKGTFFNSTTFRRGISEGFNTEMYPGEFLIKKTLEDYGLDTSGKEEFEIPLTDGSMMPLSNKIFFGLCHYQALRHHVSDKIQMRARQGVKANTRQPVSGRSKEGGLRVGEMERDALISHGGSALLRERLCDVSDAYTLPICSVCGVIAITDHVNNVYSCGVCGPTANPKIGTIRIPYVVKLLLFYLNACGIHMTFQTKNAVPDNGRMEENFLL